MEIPIGQILIISLMTGSLYGLIATGLSLIYGIMKIFNIAHGELLLIGAYLTFMLFPVNPVLAFILPVPLLFLFGAVTRKFLLTSAIIKIRTAPVIITFGLAIAIQNILMFTFGADYSGIQLSGWISRVINVGNLTIANNRLTTCIVAIVLVSLLTFFLLRTRTGKDIRATSQDAEGASLVGIDVQKMQILSFGVGFALAGVAGALLNLVQVFTPFSGMPFSLRSMTIIVLGGFSVPGALAGGLILALTESLVGYFWVVYKDVAGYLLLLAILLIKPEGLIRGQD